MSVKLPKGWVETSLDNISIVSLGKTPAKKEYRSNGFYKVVKFRDVSNGKINYSTDKDGFVIDDTSVISALKELKMLDVLTTSSAHSGENIGKKTAIVKELPEKYKKIFYTGELLNIRIPENILNSDLIANITFMFLSSEEGYKRIQKEVAGVHLTQGRAKNIIIPLPPLNEQKRIVAKLDAIMPRIEAVKERLDKVPTILKRFRQSVLTAAVTGRLTEKWRVEHPEVESAEVLFEKIKDFRIKTAESSRELNAVKKNYEEGYARLQDKEAQYPLPDTWKYCEINSIGNVYNGSTPSRKVEGYWNGNINWVSSGEVANLRINSTREQITQEGFDHSSVKLFPKGTVLIAMIGEGKTRGQTAILDIESTCNQNVAAVLINHGYVLSEYLYNWFFMQYERNRSFGSGSGPKALNCQRVREIDFILPPLEEQKEIVRQVDKLFALADKVESHYQKAKAKVDKLAQSILAKAFRGELVPQDPNDEPAEKLLERILVDKAKMEAELKSARKKTTGKKTGDKAGGKK